MIERRRVIAGLAAAPWGVALAAGAAPAVAAGAEQAFQALAARWLAETLRLDPIAATQAGEYRYNDRLTDISAAGRAARQALTGETAAALAAIDRRALSRPSQVDAAILENRLKLDRFEAETLRTWSWDPLIYSAAAGSALHDLVSRDFAPAPERLAAAVARIEALPAWLAQAREAIDPARTPKIHAETAARQNDGLMSVVDDLIAPQADVLDAPMRARLEAGTAALRSATAEHRRWLNETLVPAAQGDFRLGAELYDAKLALALDSSMSRAEIRARAETVIAQTRMEMYDIARGALAGRAGAPEAPVSPTSAQQQAVIAAALDLAAAQRPARDDLVPFARRTMEQATAFVRERNLISLPAAGDYAVELMPEFQQGVAVAYAHSPGPLDRTQKAYYAISPVPKDWTDAQAESFLREYNDRAVHELTIHEAMPGHLVQFSHANAYPSVLRAYLWSGTMVEGWGMYAEDVMAEAGYLDGDPLYLLVHLKWRLRATMNAIIDQMIHVDGAEREAVMDLLVRVCFQEEREAAGKWVRAQLSSAQLPTYFVGYSEWLDLRARAEGQLGFDQKTFHDKALSFGSPPVRFIRQMIFGEPVR